jgi:transcriptional regulator with XRE-family HTH domain
VTDFAGELRGWRQRRRVSQLELAVRAGTTQRHVSFLESGRSTPGRSMIIRLAESLGVPIRERNTLLLAAGFAPAYPQSRLDDPQLEPVRTALQRILDGHHPYPAVVVDRHGVLVSANAGFHAVVGGVAPRLLRPPVSVPRLLLDPDGLAPRIVNLDEWAWHIIDNIRAEDARNPSAELRELAAELVDLVPPRPTTNHLGFAVPLRLRTGAEARSVPPADEAIARALAAIGSPHRISGETYPRDGVDNLPRSAATGTCTPVDLRHAGSFAE